MSATINMKLTAVGAAAVWNAQGTGVKATLTHVQVGTGHRTPDGSEVGLVSPSQTTTIASGSKPSATQIRVACLFPGTSNYDFSEIGVWIGNPTSGGTLFAYCSVPSGKIGTMVSGTDFVFAHEWTMAAETAAEITILADAGQSAMLAMMAAHEGGADPHPQYATDADLAAMLAMMDALRGAAIPLVDGLAGVGTSSRYSREDHRHPTDTTRQPALGYTPVQQGTGIGQTNKTVKIGWSAAGKLKATVDTTDLGPLATEDWALPKSGGTLTGNLGVTDYLYLSGTATAAAILSSPAATARQIIYRSAGATRWSLSADAEAEIGANAGSNFAIDRYADNGTYLGSPIVISRATGIAQFNGPEATVNNPLGEARLSVASGTQALAYLYSNATGWGLWSAAGGGVLQHIRSTGKTYIAGIDTALIVQANSATYSLSITGDAGTLGGQASSYYTDIAARLGYMPLQCGGGANQNTSFVKIGWSASGYGNWLRLQVDATDFGNAWPINITGRSATAKALSTASGSAPSYAVRAWVNFDGTQTVPAIRASGNVSSVTRNWTGDYTLNFATAMPDANYAITGMPSDVANGSGTIPKVLSPTNSLQAPYIKTTAAVRVAFGTNDVNDANIIIIR